MISSFKKVLKNQDFWNPENEGIFDGIKDKIEEISDDPTRYKHLHYDLSGSCRLWIGKLRIIFSYDINKREIYLEKIVLGHKY